MASWLPGIFQKRLLKYALSRLEFIDTEALDPDSLGIRWGQRSTVELRDIGLRLEKIATLLNLPASSKLLSARIRFLRLTVPADIYSSGIICEVSGVEVHLRLPSEKDACTVKDRFLEGHETIIPNPEDLAQSFLQTEPKEEKEELQAAISSRSEILHRTTASISDDEEELGLGDESISLPSFIAGFLQGIADRLQFQIDEISLRVEMETKQDGSSKRQPEDIPDVISALFRVQQVSVGAVITTSAPDEHSLHLGKRPVSFSDVDMSIVAEPIVFSNYSRFTAPGSPSTHLPSKSSQASSPTSSIPRAPSSVSSSSHAMMASTIFEPSRRMTDPPHLEHDSSRLHESAYTYDGRFSDADTEETRSHGYLEHSQTLSDDERLLDNPAYLDSVIDSQLQDDDLDELDDPPPEYFDGPNPETSTPRSQGSVSQALGDSATRSVSGATLLTAASEPNVRNVQTSYPVEENYVPQSSMPDLPYRFEDVSEDRSQTLPVRPTLSTANSSSSSASSSMDDELSESKLFSSEQAQSMYMSAMSHGSNSRSFMPNMPGGWESPEATWTRGYGHNRDSSDFTEGPTETAEDDQDNTPVSTPKPTDTDARFPLGHPSFVRPSDIHSERTDNSSVRSTSDPNEVTDVAKRFLHVDRITIWIPSVKQEKKHLDPSESSYSEGTGRFEDSTAHLEASYTAEKSVFFGKTRLPSRTRRDSIDLAYPEPKQKFDTKHGRGISNSEHDLHVEISSIEIQLDIAIGWLAIKFGQRVLQAFCGNGQPSKKDKPPQKDAEEAQSFSLTLGKLAIKFVESVPGSPFPHQGQQEPASFLDFLHNDIILQTTSSNLKAHYSTSKDKTRFSAEVSKFTIGFASENLISFSEEFKMRESTRDILAPVGNDISLSLIKSRDSATFTVSTLPLHVNLNIPRLEELLGCFGGLSTIMELGSSISSISGNKPPKKDVPKRGVRFEGVPLPSSKKQAANVAWGVNARIGGIALDVTGEIHYLTLRSTAVKIVSRPDYIGLSIDKVWLDGPFSLHDSRDAPVNINLNLIRVEYLYTPTEPDLDRLLSLITPSKARYGEEDDIMIGTLFRQRKQGSVLRVTVGGAKIEVTRPELGPLQQLGEELGRLSTVAKYLPEDDRPGILTLALIRDLETELNLGGMIGTITVNLQDAEAAHISIPSLIAAQLGSISVVRNGDEELVGEAIPSMPEPIPVLMVRFIADEMDPTIKVKLHNLRVEYTISAMTALLGISDDMESGDVAANMAYSLANIAELHPPSQKSRKDERPSSPVKPLKLSFDLLDSVVGLNPRGTAARGLVVLTQSRFSSAIHDLASSEATLDLKKASILIIDDVDNVDMAAPAPRRRPTSQTSQVQTFLDMGYVSVSSISSATATVKIMRLSDDGTKSLDVEIRDDLLILETCADSTQTLISILNGLQPPSPPNVVEKYRTQVVPIQNMLESFTGDAFATGGEDASSKVVDAADIPEPDDLEYVTDFDSPGIQASDSDNFGGKFQSQYHVSSSMSELDFRDDHFMQQSSVGGTAHRWDSTQNTYDLADNSKLQKSPLRVRVRDAHVIWNLFDGYDWQRTRDAISQAVKDVEKKAADRRANDRASPGFDDDEEDVIGDCLFNSVYIGIPANKDPSELREGINRNIDDVISETGSYATTSTATTMRRNTSPGVKRKKLRLSRSKAHKMTFELKGICADLVVFPPNSGETLNSLDVRVNELIIFDHIPTSTWKKFATYMREAGEKETGTSMVHLEILTVKPVSELAASELILKVTVLPLRLHVDQDALDFLTRFFEFRDDSVPPAETPQERPYLQRSEVNAVPVKLDFKPKRVDYAGLRSGRTTEFMNFIILEEADMILKRVIVYGADGFDKLGQTLNDTWMPEIKQHQLPGILAGLAPIRPLVNVGSGVRDLVMVPMREYRKDGRIVRSIQKGAFAFGKTTSNELVKLGAKLAIGTQTVLQGAEELFNTPSGQPAGVDEDEIDEDEAARKISLYADQPLGVVQGLRGGFRGLERDLLLTRDAIIAMPGDVQESGSAKAAAKAVLKRAPTVILRPAIGISKAVGQTLLGAGNSLDPSHRRKIEDVSARIIPLVA